MQETIRPINYLGSKLRILDEIKRQLDVLDPKQGAVCDLFSGSGTVSNYLARTRKIIAFDIQEYSRVICSALLQKRNTIKSGLDVVQECKESSHFKGLKDIFGDLVEYEKKCIDLAIKGKANQPLCDFLENASLVSYGSDGSNSIYEEFNCILEECYTSYADSKMYGKYGRITYLYGGVYFSFEQAIQIDTLLWWIENRGLNENRDKYLAAVISATSDIVNTIGKQFAQPISPRNASGKIKKTIGTMIYRDRCLSFWDSFGFWIDYYGKCGHEGCEAYKNNYVEAIRKLENDVHVVYADPPYTRYHYSRYYHVLETIALGDFPNISKVKINGQQKVSKGVYRKERHQSSFSIKSMAHKAFEEMFTELHKKNVKLVLSYSPYDSTSQSTPRMVSIEDICAIAKQYYKNINIITIDNVAHNKFNNKEKNFKVNCPAEILIVCF